MKYGIIKHYCVLYGRQYKVPISHESRQVSQKDFYNFTHILASDGSNLNNLLRIKPGDSTAEVKLWGSYHDGEPIADPYYGGAVSCVRIQCRIRNLTTISDPERIRRHLPTMR
jgi:protein-tyrosine-phosphatase